MSHDIPPGQPASVPGSYRIEPTSQDAWRLTGHYLNHRCHSDPGWRQVDQRASRLREELAVLPVQRGQDVTVAMWLPLTKRPRRMRGTGLHGPPDVPDQ
jgi:hypothetical protein